MEHSARGLRSWTRDLINAQCAAEYRVYEAALIRHYTNYFANRPYLRCSKHRYSARTIHDALPPATGDLQDLIPRHRFHRFARSGRSSQVVGLGLLGSAARSEPSLQWFWQAVGLAGLGSQPSTFAFEYSLSPSILKEHPRVTQIDFVVSNPVALAAVEMKLSEPDFGACSCVRDGDGNPNIGFDCSARVRARKMYWQAARDCFGLDEVRLSFASCSLSMAYQIIRTAAAARALAGGRTPICVVIYDERNPYFAQTGSWPGWPSVLRNSYQSPVTTLLKTISWQRLLPQLPLPDVVRRWAMEKHCLGGV